MEKQKLGLSEGLDTYDCRVCEMELSSGVTYKGYRACLKGCDKRMPVEFGEGPAISLSRRELCTVLPSTEPYKYLMARMASINGKMICPVALVDAYSEDIITLVQTEADMCNGDGGWGVPAFDGPTSEWPAKMLQLLRHVRGQKGLMSKRKHEEMEKKADAANQAPQQPQGLVHG